MKAFIDVDIQECLRRVVEENTLYYKTDFEYDIGKLKNTVFFHSPKNLLWFSRESGTHCFDERQVYLTPTYANHTWLYYQKNAEEIKAFYIEVSDFKEGRALGSLVALDYPSHCEQVKEFMQPAQTAIVTFIDGFKRTFDVGEFEENRDAIQYKYGPYSSVEYDRPYDLNNLMYHIHYRLKHDIKPYDFDRFMEEMRQERFERVGYHGNDYVWLSPYDAHACHKIGLPVFLLHQDEPLHAICNWDEVANLRYKSGHLLAIRRQDKPVWEYINPERPKSEPLFTQKELSSLYWCVSNAGKDQDITPEENQHLQGLLGKLNVIIGAGEKEVIVVEPEQGQEPEP
ncbi:hypothetical protein [Dehalobacterium formicoaceticum]|uniref:hypothetical protein n=1 Tax=Dehalobacterium formicoaceticum TaxID=51515 RepID=UPI0031F6542E